MQMAEITQLTIDLWCVQSTIYAMNSGIWLRDGAACLVDPGVLPDEIEHIAAFLEARGAAPHFLVLTHCHYDHILGTQLFANTPVVAHARYEDEVALHGPAILAHERLLIPDSTFEIPHPHVTVTEAMTLNVDTLAIRLVHAPGHAPDELVLYEPTTATLWAGDMLSDREIPYVSDSLAAYERTLAMLATYEVATLVPGHGRPTSKAAEIQQRLDNDRQYLAALRSTIATAIRQGCTLEETVAQCAGQPLPYPDQEAMHRLNVESAYVEMGGPGNPDEVGWGRG